MAKVVFEETTCREIPEALRISPADDGWHPLKHPNYIEWWYFDVVSRDGGIVRGHFYISGNILRSRGVRTGVRASYVKPDGTEIMIDERFPYSSFKASTEVCDVGIGKNFLKGNLSHYELHVEDSEKALDLELDSNITGITSRACFGDEKRYMYWVVPQPRGWAKGTLRTKEGTFVIEGVGYRDHNWLNFSPLDYIAHWDWGRIYDREFTIIFADIVTSKRLESAEIKPLMIYDVSKFRYLTTESGKWTLTKKGGRLDPDTKVEIPERHLLKAEGDDIALEIDLKLEKVFQKIDPLEDFNPLLRWFIRTFKAKPSITSFFSTGSGKLKLSGQENVLTCTAVHELVKNM
jgi:hypothetical protein